MTNRMRHIGYWTPLPCLDSSNPYKVAWVKETRRALLADNRTARRSITHLLIVTLLLLQKRHTMTVTLEPPVSVHPVSESPKKAFREYNKPVPETADAYQPSHSGLFRVVLDKGKGVDGVDSFSSYLVAEKVRV